MFVSQLSFLVVRVFDTALLELERFLFCFVVAVVFRSQITHVFLSQDFRFALAVRLRS